MQKLRSMTILVATSAHGYGSWPGMHRFVCRMRKPPHDSLHTLRSAPYTLTLTLADMFEAKAHRRSEHAAAATM